MLGGMQIQVPTYITLLEDYENLEKSLHTMKMSENQYSVVIIFGPAGIKKQTQF